MWQRVIIFNAIILGTFGTSAVFAQASNATDNKYYMKQYQKLLDDERQKRSDEYYVENVSAGIAATVIGFYGYYFDSRGALTKVAYALTQTAGVLLISDAVYSRSRPSLLLYSDRFIQKNGPMDHEDYVKGVVDTHFAEQTASAKQTAITAGILGIIYGYNGYREEDLPSIKNAYYFLSFNFGLISIISGYKFFNANKFGRDNQNLSFNLIPYPEIQYRF